MTREEASTILGGAKTGVEASVAFRDLSKTCHPDGPTPNAELWASISEAKRVLTAPAKCAACKGEGRIMRGGIRMFCQDCGGRGSYA